MRCQKTHAQIQLALSVFLCYFLWGILRKPSTAASTSHSRQVSVANGDLWHDDTRRRQRERVAAADVKPLSQEDQRFPVCHCG